MARINYEPKHVPHTTRRTLFAAGDLRGLRKLLGINQTDFWTPVGVTQSGGCRYESGRDVAGPVLELVRLYWVEGIEFAKLNRAEVSGTRQLVWEGE